MQRQFHSSGPPVELYSGDPREGREVQSPGECVLAQVLEFIVTVHSLLMTCGSLLDCLELKV